MNNNRAQLWFSVAICTLIITVGCSSKKELASSKTALIEANEQIAALKAENKKYVDEAQDIQVMYDEQAEVLSALNDRLFALDDEIYQKSQLLERVKNELKESLIDYSPEEMPIVIRENKILLSPSERFLFESGSVELDIEEKKALMKVAEVLNRNPQVHITIEGHTDNVEVISTYADNWELSTERALAVGRYLIQEGGVFPNQISVAGRGASTPLVGNASENGRSLNRRVVLVVEPQTDSLIELVGDLVESTDD